MSEFEHKKKRRASFKTLRYTYYNMVSAIDTHFHRRMLLFYCKEKGHLSSKSVLY